MNLFITYRDGLGFSEFLVHFPGVGGIASSRQLLDAAMEFQAAKDFDKARIFPPDSLVLGAFICWQHVGQHRGS